MGAHTLPSEEEAISLDFFEVFSKMRQDRRGKRVFNLVPIVFDDIIFLDVLEDRIFLLPEFLRKRLQIRLFLLRSGYDSQTFHFSEPSGGFSSSGCLMLISPP